MILQVLKVQGDSLTPAYQDGDYVLASRIPILLRPPRAGDVIVFRHRVYGTLIKIVERVEPGGKDFFVVGLIPESVDSRVFGPVPAAQVTGKVILRVAKRVPKPGR